MKKPLLATCMSFALTGCAQPATTPTPSAIAQESSVTAFARLDVRDTADRQVLATLGVLPWTKTDIDHVKVFLYEDGTLKATLTVRQADLTNTLTFTNLRRYATYKIEVKAWADALETSPIDNFDADAASCTTSFTTTNLDTVSVGSLKLRLRNKIFSGTTTGSAIEVTDGTVEDTASTAAIFVTPADTPLDGGEGGGEV